MAIAATTESSRTGILVCNFQIIIFPNPTGLKIHYRVLSFFAAFFLVAGCLPGPLDVFLFPRAT